MLRNAENIRPFAVLSRGIVSSRCSSGNLRQRRRSGQKWNCKWDFRVNMLQLGWGDIPCTVSGGEQLHHWATDAAAASPHLSTTTTGNTMIMRTFVFIFIYNQSHRIRNTSKW